MIIKLEKLVNKFKLNKEEAGVLTKNLEVVEFYEKVSEKIDPRFALPWITIELLRVLNWNKKTLDQVEIKPEHVIVLAIIVMVVVVSLHIFGAGILGI